MDTNYAPLLTDLYLSSHEAEVMQRIIKHIFFLEIVMSFIASSMG
jgi:hypothetical protein